MSRCVACDKRLLDDELRVGHDLCHYCKPISDACVEDRFDDGYKFYALEDAKTGVTQVVTLDDYDSID